MTDLLLHVALAQQARMHVALHASTSCSDADMLNWTMTGTDSTKLFPECGMQSL
jgi:hypothetical protein